jgi:hypothetical protein
VTGLVELLEQPAAAGVNPPDKPVWHCSLHNHAEDPLLSTAAGGAMGQHVGYESWLERDLNRTLLMVIVR